MKKFILGGLFAVLFSLSVGVTTVYAEDTETNGTVSEMESVEETSELESIVDDSVNETITSEEISVDNVEESHLQTWFEETVMPYLGIALAGAGGTASVVTILAFLVKYLLKKFEGKLKEAYEKKSEAEKQQYDFNVLMSEFTGTLTQTVETLKAVFESKGETLEQTSLMFLDMYNDLQEKIKEMANIVSQVTNSNVELNKTITSENEKLHTLMQAEQKQMRQLSHEEMKLITDILVIAYTNNPHLVSNGYATNIKLAVEEYEKNKKQSENI
jgi:hypothetical protein